MSVPSFLSSEDILLAIAAKYCGGMVAEQLESTLDDSSPETFGEQNSNALADLARLMQTVKNSCSEDMDCSGLAQAAESWLNEYQAFKDNPPSPEEDGE